MARLARATYALMVSLLPATATVIGVVVLTQIPTVPELAGIALVVAGVALRREPSEPSATPTRAARRRLHGDPEAAPG
jgi:inner membrane transporter RhtA